MLGQERAAESIVDRFLARRAAAELQGNKGAVGNALYADYAASLSDDDDREKLVAVAGLMHGEIDRIATCRADFTTTWAAFRVLAA